MEKVEKEEEETLVEDARVIASWVPKGLKLIPKWTSFFVNDVRAKQAPVPVGLAFDEWYQSSTLLHCAH